MLIYANCDVYWLQQESRESGDGKGNFDTNDQHCFEANGI
jgi:hypothetical protein